MTDWLACLTHWTLPPAQVEVFGLHVAEEVGFLTGGQRAEAALPLTTGCSPHVLEQRVFKL